MKGRYTILNKIISLWMNFDGKKPFKPKERFSYIVFWTLPPCLFPFSLFAFSFSSTSPALPWDCKYNFLKKKLYIIIFFSQCWHCYSKRGLINKVRVSAFVIKIGIRTKSLGIKSYIHPKDERCCTTKQGLGHTFTKSVLGKKINDKHRLFLLWAKRICGLQEFNPNLCS